MRDDVEPRPLEAWRRGRPAAPEPEARPLRCGGPDYTNAERLELMRQRQREMDEAARREREQSESRQSTRRRGISESDGDDEYPSERRADRYAVGLLRQDDAAWGGTGCGTGGLG
ncbi:hypothetical protein O7608_15755 [Solwaraspora sp. WMMA2056]|uniref:hypothetical protein n=1 Tax=Solwaraspora sp. WMMA2056 TaxID=3015161 RepID=UPI00259B4D14|nr:hypothetical protein [Solwaraspora sp. WMMA2056]WJK43732.1 hypothetical protein O7608_15755 [Solwaraspora sp. WMMA2056]